MGGRAVVGRSPLSTWAVAVKARPELDVYGSTPPSIARLLAGELDPAPAYRLGAPSQEKRRDKTMSMPSILMRVRSRPPARSGGRHLWHLLPEGQPLPAAVWQSRHQGILVVLWLHAVGLLGFGLLSGAGLWHSLADASIVAGPPLAGQLGAGQPPAARRAGEPGADHRLRGVGASLGGLY